MREGWIPLECQSCTEQWEENPSDLPPRRTDFVCPHCETTRPIDEFVATQEGLKILDKFHA